jgi:hypothetical protein
MFSKKKSQGHVEMIISFAIFISALIFIFLFINPFEEKTPDNHVNEVQEAILKNLNSEIEKLSVVITNTAEDCYDTYPYGNDFIEVKDADRKFTLYYNLSGSGIKSCSANLRREFTQGTYSREEFISYEKAGDFAEMYNLDYNQVKSIIRTSSDFSFSIKEINGNEISEISVSREIPKGIEVYSKEIISRMIYSDAQIKNIILTVRVW